MCLGYDVLKSVTHLGVCFFGFRDVETRREPVLGTLKEALLGILELTIGGFKQISGNNWASRTLALNTLALSNELTQTEQEVL